MAVITGIPADVGLQARDVRAYELRYDRVAGAVFIVSALAWFGLLLHGFVLTSDQTTFLPLETNLRNTTSLSILALIVLAVLDGGVAFLLIRWRPISTRVARLRGLAGVVVCAIYFVATRDFGTTLVLGTVQGFILALLSRNAALLMIYPSVIWLGVFFLVPLISIFLFSLGTSTARGIDMSAPSLDNYSRILSPVGVSGLVYVNIIVRTIWIAFLNTLLCLLIGYPFAFWMSRQPERLRNALLMLVMIPFWTSILVRTYAWLIILRKDGLLNGLIVNILHLTDQPLEMTNTPGALLLGMVYDYLPFMVLPLYGSIESLNGSLLEAANDLYANPRQTFLRVILPLTTPGIVAGSILVFIPSIGTYVISNILGGGRYFLIGNLLEQQFIGTTGDRAFGAAIGFVLTALMLIATVAYFRLGRRNR